MYMQKGTCMFILYWLMVMNIYIYIYTVSILDCILYLLHIPDDSLTLYH